MESNKETIYTEGIRIFAPREGAPDFVKGNVVVTPNELIAFLKTQEEHASEYKGTKQFRMALLEGRNGLYLTLDTYKAPAKQEEAQAENSQDDGDLPF